MFSTGDKYDERGIQIIKVFSQRIVFSSLTPFTRLMENGTVFKLEVTIIQIKYISNTGFLKILTYYSTSFI